MAQWYSDGARELVYSYLCAWLDADTAVADVLLRSDDPSSYTNLDSLAYSNRHGYCHSDMDTSGCNPYRRTYTVVATRGSSAIMRSGKWHASQPLWVHRPDSADQPDRTIQLRCGFLRADCRRYSDFGLHRRARHPLSWHS